jgi:hypothetical protein
MNDPHQYEKERYVDAIDEYNCIIDELQKLYDKTPASDRFVRLKILNGMEQTKRELAKTRAGYEIFKKYKARTAISK